MSQLYKWLRHLSNGVSPIQIEAVLIGSVWLPRCPHVCTSPAVHSLRDQRLVPCFLGSADAIACGHTASRHAAELGVSAKPGWADAAAATRPTCQTLKLNGLHPLIQSTKQCLSFFCIRSCNLTKHLLFWYTVPCSLRPLIQIYDANLIRQPNTPIIVESHCGFLEYHRRKREAKRHPEDWGGNVWENENAGNSCNCCGKQISVINCWYSISIILYLYDSSLKIIFRLIHFLWLLFSILLDNDITACGIVNY